MRPHPALLPLCLVALALAGSCASTPATPQASAAPPAPARKLRVACVGEQTTHSAHREYDPEYPERMAALLGDDYEVKNFGLPKGMVLRQGTASGSEPYLGSPAFNDSVAFAPDVVVVGPWGRHDTYKGNWPERQGEFAGDLEALLNAYTALPNKPTVLVVLPLPLSGETRAPMADLVEPTRAVAAKLGLRTVDLWGAFLGRRELYKDGTHLTPDGQQHHASVIAEAVRASR